MVILVNPAFASEILKCTTTDSVGFFWEKDATVKRGAWPTSTFKVIVISQTKRQVRLPNSPFTSNYVCRKRRENKIACVDEISPSSYPIVFQGLKFERVFNNSAHVGGDPQLSVAYGVCSPQ